MFRRNDGPLNAAVVYPKIEVCCGPLRVAGAGFTQAPGPRVGSKLESAVFPRVRRTVAGGA